MLLEPRAERNFRNVMTEAEEERIRPENEGRKNRRKHSKPKVMSHLEECTGMMSLSRKKVRIKGLTIENTKKWVLSAKILTDRQILFERDGESGQEDTVADVLANILRMYPSEIERNMEEVYITTKGEFIVWLVAEEKFV